MEIIEELGEPLNPAQAAEALGIDVSTARRYFSELGGRRIGGHKIIFYKRLVADAVSKLQQKPGSLPLVGSGENDPDQRGAGNQEETVQDKKGGDIVGSRRKGQARNGSRRASTDRHSLFEKVV